MIFEARPGRVSSVMRGRELLYLYSEYPGLGDLIHSEVTLMYNTALHTTHSHATTALSTACGHSTLQTLLLTTLLVHWRGRPSTQDRFSAALAWDLGTELAALASPSHKDPEDGHIMHTLPGFFATSPRHAASLPSPSFSPLIAHFFGGFFCF